MESAPRGWRAIACSPDPEAFEKGARCAAPALARVGPGKIRFRGKKAEEDGQTPIRDVLDETESLLGFELESFLAASGDWQSEVEQRLRRLHGRIGDWNADELECKQVRRVVQQTYSRGAQALRKAMNKPTAENFHTFRKT